MVRIATVLLALGVAVVGCAGNDGGSTTCQDFTAMTTDARGAAIAKMLKERNGRNASTGEVEARVTSTLSACASNDQLEQTIEAVNF